MVCRATSLKLNPLVLLEELGTQVAYIYRNDANIHKSSLALQTDVTDPIAMAQVVEVVEQKLGAIYGVVANAGITRDNA